MVGGTATALWQLQPVPAQFQGWLCSSLSSAFAQQLKHGNSRWKLDVGSPEVTLSLEVRPVGTPGMGSSLPLDFP